MLFRSHAQQIDPTFPIELLRVRRETERAFAGIDDRELWFKDVISTDLVGAGLTAVARWFKKDV